MSYTQKVLEELKARYPEQPEFIQAATEILGTIQPALDAHPEYEEAALLERLVEPERIVMFRVPWVDDQGKVQVNHNWFLGYTKDESGKLVIVPEEAEVVRRIYREYLEGASFVKIRRGLEADGILNGAKHARWHETNIKQILTNEKYIGDALLQKTYTVSILDKKRSVNDGAMPKYYVEG